MCLGGGFRQGKSMRSGGLGRVQPFEIGFHLLWRLAGVMHGQAEVDVAALAADGDGQVEAGAVALEERIEGGEKDGLPSGDHLRGGGLGEDVAFELVGIAGEEVDAVEVHLASGDLVAKRVYGHGSVGEREVDGHLGGDLGFAVGAGGLHVFGLALRAQAEAVDAVLQLGVAELDVLDAEIAGDLHLLRDADVARWDVQLDLFGEDAGHDGRLGLHAELEHVLDAAVGHVDGERNVVAFTPQVGDGALTGEVRLPEDGLDGVESGSAGGGVDEGVEGGFEADGVVADVEREVRGAGGAIDDESAEAALEASGGAEGAADAFDGAEVDVGVGVLAVNRSSTGVVAAPGAEVPGGVDLAEGNGIGEVGGVLHWLRSVRVGELQALDDEAQRGFAGLVVFDDEVHVAAVDLGDGDSDAPLRCGNEGVVAAAVRRDAEVHAIDVDVREIDAVVEKGAQGSVEGKGVDGEHGLGAETVLLCQAGLAGTGEVGDAKAAAMDTNAIAQSDVERIKLHGGVEAGSQVGDDAVAEQRADVVDEVIGGDGKRDEECGDSDGDDLEPAVADSVPLARRTVDGRT